MPKEAVEHTQEFLPAMAVNSRGRRGRPAELGGRRGQDLAVIWIPLTGIRTSKGPNERAPVTLR